MSKLKPYVDLEQVCGCGSGVGDAVQIGASNATSWADDDSTAEIHHALR